MSFNFLSDLPIFDETVLTAIAQTTNAKNSITARKTTYRGRMLSFAATDKKNKTI